MVIDTFLGKLFSLMQSLSTASAQEESLPTLVASQHPPQTVLKLEISRTPPPQGFIQKSKPWKLRVYYVAYDLHMVLIRKCVL